MKTHKIDISLRCARNCACTRTSSAARKTLRTVALWRIKWRTVCVLGLRGCWSHARLRASAGELANQPTLARTRACTQTHTKCTHAHAFYIHMVHTSARERLREECASRWVFGIYGRQKRTVRARSPICVACDKRVNEKRICLQKLSRSLGGSAWSVDRSVGRSQPQLVVFGIKHSNARVCVVFVFATFLPPPQSRTNITNIPIARARLRLARDKSA